MDWMNTLVTVSSWVTFIFAPIFALLVALYFLGRKVWRIKYPKKQRYFFLSKRRG